MPLPDKGLSVFSTTEILGFLILGISYFIVFLAILDIHRIIHIKHISQKKIKIY
jgi:hypothetical protein